MNCDKVFGAFFGLLFLFYRRATSKYKCPKNRGKENPAKRNFIPVATSAFQKPKLTNAEIAQRIKGLK